MRSAKISPSFHRDDETECHARPFQFAGRVRCQRGMAMLELAAWMVVLLPVTLAAFALCATAHDRNIVQAVPESLMREIGGGVMTWRSNGAGGEFEVDLQRVVTMADVLVERAFSDLSQGAVKLSSPAARACYWVYDVNPSLGTATTIRRQGCVHRNDAGGGLNGSLEHAREKRVSAGIAEPIRFGADKTQGYVSQAVLIGVSVGGEFQGLERLHDSAPVRHAAVWIPRGDLAL